MDYPTEMKKYTQWVCWKYDEIGGRIRKVPYNPKTGGMAQANNPKTWTHYETATAALSHYDGLGFVFTAQDPFVGIDLDHCVDQTGRIEKEAYGICRSMGTYCEKSPSGTGLHLIGIGVLPDRQKGRRRENIEVYTEGRYFTMTGNVFNPAWQHIKPIQEQLDYLVEVIWPERKEYTAVVPAGTTDFLDDELLELLFEQQNGDTIIQLWNGENPRYGGDVSRNDLYFCWLVNFRNNNDLEQTDRIFRKSKRMRPKWDTVHFSSGETYGQRTLQRSINQGVKY